MVVVVVFLGMGIGQGGADLGISSSSLVGALHLLRLLCLESTGESSVPNDTRSEQECSDVGFSKTCSKPTGASVI
jgi:hypothetical protein